MSRPLFLLLTLCLLSTFIHADADESTEPEFDSTIEKDTTTSSSTTDEPKLPIDNVYKRGLVVNHVIPKDIIDNHAHVFKDLIPKQFTGETLGYITPWNRRGMEIAIEHGKKFDYLSPVWYQIKVTYNKKKLKVFITGGHDADDKLLESLRRHSIRQMGHDPEGEMIRARIVPRFILEVEENIYGKVAENVKLQDAIINKVHKELEKHKYDGLVLEMTDAWAVIARNKGNRKGLNSFINRLGASLHNDETKRLLILVVRPFFPNTPYFAHADFMATYQNVDKFQIMTYDYSHSAPGPSSPINWMFAVFKEFVGKDNVENEQFTSKILLGLNWYGIDFGDSTGPKAVLGHEYVKILSDHPDATIQWVEDYGEHYTNYTKTDEKGMVTSHQVYYPSLKSLALRLSMATKLKLGVAIWELGQGLNYFLDLF